MTPLGISPCRYLPRAHAVPADLSTEDQTPPRPALVGVCYKFVDDRFNLGTQEAPGRKLKLSNVVYEILQQKVIEFLKENGSSEGTLYLRPGRMSLL